MRILITGWGAIGDLAPVAFTGGELRRRGHDVTLHANPYFANLAASAGVEFVAVGNVEDYHCLQRDSGVFGRDRKSDHDLYVEHYFPHVGEFYEAAASQYDAGRTVILGNEMGALTLAEQYHLPWIQMIVSPGYMKSGHDPCHPDRVLPAALRWLARTPQGMRLLWRLNALRGGRPAPTRDPNRQMIFPPNHPLMPVRRKAGLSATMSLRARVSLCAWPDWFAAPQPDWPGHAHTTGFLLPPGAAVMRGLKAGPEQPGDGGRPIVFTTGSTASSQSQLFAAAIEVCRRLKRPGHLVTPVREQVPVDLPPEVTYSAHVPFESLFPRAALVVHHGGIGTGALALAAGIPQLLCPMRGDQFDNSNRLQRLGVGKIVDARRITPDGLTRDVLGLLGSAAVARQCAHRAKKVSTEDGVKRCADLVESVLESGAGGLVVGTQDAPSDQQPPHPAQRHRGKTFPLFCACPGDRSPAPD